MRRLLPGPYTFILEATRLVPKILVEKKNTVGIRVPDNLVCHTLLQEFGAPIISTSAGLPDNQYMNDPDEIADSFEHFIDLFLDNGFGGIEPSTVIDLSGDTPLLIREGKNFDKSLLG